MASSKRLSVREIFWNLFNLPECSAISTAHLGKRFSPSERQGLDARRALVVFSMGGFFVDLMGFYFDVCATTFIFRVI